MKTCTILTGACLLGLLAACSGGNSDSGSSDNVFKQQTQAIDKAKEANKIMLQRAQEEKKQIDNIDQ